MIIDKIREIGYTDFMNNVREIAKKINDIETITDVPMKERTTFRTGGCADLMIFPDNEQELQTVLKLLSEENLPFFILGGGANLLVSDDGIREPVISLEKMNRITVDGCRIRAEAGASVEDVCTAALDSCLSGVEFLYRLPGSVGGAVRMNARCYDHSICEVLDQIVYFDKNGKPLRRTPEEGGFGYKQSPFQNNGTVVTAAVFRLQKGNRTQIEAAMKANESDRERKGHFRYPCAGSIFKNDRRFGKPSGILIDEAGLRGLREGGAQVAPFHGNIIINTGKATSTEIRNLIETVRSRVFSSCGCRLEPEVVFAGEWKMSPLSL